MTTEDVRLLSWVLGVFAAVALPLAAYLVSRPTHRRDPRGVAEQPRLEPDELVTKLRYDLR